MGKDVKVLFGRTVALQGNIVPMMPNFLGGTNAVHGMQDNAFRKCFLDPLMPYPPMPYRLMHQTSIQEVIQ